MPPESPAPGWSSGEVCRLMAAIRAAGSVITDIAGEYVSIRKGKNPPGGRVLPPRAEAVSWPCGRSASAPPSPGPCERSWPRPSAGARPAWCPPRPASRGRSAGSASPASRPGRPAPHRLPRPPAPRSSEPGRTWPWLARRRTRRCRGSRREPSSAGPSFRHLLLQFGGFRCLGPAPAAPGLLLPLGLRPEARVDLHQNLLLPFGDGPVRQDRTDQVAVVALPLVEDPGLDIQRLG